MTNLTINRGKIVCKIFLIQLGNMTPNHISHRIHLPVPLADIINRIRVVLHLRFLQPTQLFGKPPFVLRRKFQETTLKLILDLRIFIA